MAELIRCITSDGTVTAVAIDSTDIVAEAEQRHKTSAVVTAALGRLLTAASMMGNTLKSEKGSVTVKLDGQGPTGAITAVADADGNVRGYAANPLVEIPLKPNGKLDVSGAVGTNGSLFVTKDLGMKEPYSGYVPLVSGEIAEDITSYFAVSEQIPTVCALGVLVDRDLTVKKAGGYLIQLLPTADDAAIDQLEQNIKIMRPVTELLDQGKSIEEIVREALAGFETEVLARETPAYTCKCSREKVKRTLKSLGAQELTEMARELPETEVSCRFCGSRYVFPKEEILELAKS